MTLSCPVRAPFFVGVKVTEIVQLWLGASIAAHWFVSAKSPVVVIEVRDRSSEPVFVKVTVMGALC